MKIALLAIVFVFYKVSQAFPAPPCTVGDFKLNEKLETLNGCIVEICTHRKFGESNCTMLSNAGRCGADDLDVPNRKMACDCCFSPNIAIHPQIVFDPEMPGK
ncbi:uncharacterized protein LOC125679826 [Ostrea edulis]|uniref:uncharacterized protein LOC125679826 n=1 Tax=Ostrea edulis TaxID=37623 RepID=UPI002094C189|nr:uncharacterized protein LOC125679826 [Ostrea edulis]